MRVDIPPRTGSTNAPVALCLEPHDLVLAKLVRGAARDVDYAVAAVQANLVDIAVLQQRAADLPADPAVIDAVATHMRVLAGSTSPPS